MLCPGGDASEQEIVRTRQRLKAVLRAFRGTKDFRHFTRQGDAYQAAHDMCRHAARMPRSPGCPGRPTPGRPGPEPRPSALEAPPPPTLRPSPCPARRALKGLHAPRTLVITMPPSRHLVIT